RFQGGKRGHRRTAEGGNAPTGQSQEDRRSPEAGRVRQRREKGGPPGSSAGGRRGASSSGSREVEVVGVLAGLDGSLQAGGAPGGVLLRDEVEGPALGGGPGPGAAGEVAELLEMLDHPRLIDAADQNLGLADADAGAVGPVGTDRRRVGGAVAAEN